jgi:glycosyltransferase involved in cell wall biosynthesis
MKPTISIITPTYNHERYIHECIESVLNQTYPNWEMIIMDDGSTDATPAVISRYRDARITYIRKDHQGIDKLGESYNEALQRCKGELILILEGDDYVPAKRLEIQQSAFVDPQVVLSHGKYAYVFDRKRIVYPTPFRQEILRNRPIGSALKVFLQGFNPIGTQSVMIRKSTLLEIGGFTQPAYLPLVDYPTWMKLALKGTFEFIPEVLGFWRRHPNSITINQSDQIFAGFIQYCDEFVDAFQSELTKLGMANFIKNKGGIGYLSLSWAALGNQDWSHAREYARKSWSCKEVMDVSYRLKIMFAMLGAYLHMDLPAVLKSIKQAFYGQSLNHRVHRMLKGRG